MATHISEPVLHDLPNDPLQVWEYFYERGWCDGFPIIPPTPERVAMLLEGVGLDRSEVIGRITPSDNPVTVEKIAVNAAMAGCVPGSLPVLIAAVQGVAVDAFKLLSVGTTPATPLIIINGPIRHELGVNSGYCCFGGIARVNATIGHALRLITLNLGNGGAKNIVDQATHGLPTRVSFCAGENEEGSPWEPFHVEHGFAPEQSTVTVVNAATPMGIVDMESLNADEMLMTFAGSISFQGSNNMETASGTPLLVVGPEHAPVFAREGMSKDDLRTALWERASVPVSKFPSKLREKFERNGRPVYDGCVRLTAKPEDLQVIVAGGMGPHSLFISSIGRYQINPIG